MKHINLISAVAAAIGLSAGIAHAAGAGMEKCTVVDKNGVGLIKAHKADCKGATHSCAGQNKAGDAKSWIIVPKGQCTKINSGDFSGVNPSVKAKLNLPS